MQKKILAKPVFEITTPWGFFNGVSQGHPAVSGAGTALFINQSHYLHKKYALGIGSNNKAEFVALWVLLSVAICSGCKRLQVMGDSKFFIDWETTNRK